jgi:hypothetical protein
MIETSDRVLIARYVLGVAESWELPIIADALMNIGPSTPAMAELATMRNPVMAEAGPLFEQALRERGVQIPSREEAIWTLLRYYLQGIADGSIMPKEGLSLVVRGAYYPGKLYERSEKFAGDSHDLQHLIGAYYEYDDLYKPGDVNQLNAEVVKLALEWIERNGSE